MSAKILGRLAIVTTFVLLAVFTYPGADLASLAVWLTPPARAVGGPSQGALSWLHVSHPAGRTPFIADESGRMVLLHGAIPGGLIDYWASDNPSDPNPPPYYPIDSTAYVNSCPANSAFSIHAPPFCQTDVEQMASYGFNSIRLPLSWSLLEPQRRRYSQAYLDRVAQVVDWARASRMYVILDMHQNAYSRYVGRSDPPPLPDVTPADLRYDDGAPAWATITDGFPSEVYHSQREVNPAVMEATNNFWYNRDGIQAEYISAVAHLMNRFKDDSTVAGLSVYNEPWPGWNLPPGFEDLLLFPFYRRVIDAITGIHDGLPCPTQVYMPAPCGFPDLGVHDQNQLFFLDTGLLREITDFPTHLGLPVSSYSNLVLGIHTYTHGYTLDALAGQKPGNATYPPGGYDQSYALAEREARAINAALFVTEFGNDPKWDPLILSNELVEQEKHLVGFAFWTWKENCGGADSWGMFDGIGCPSSGLSALQPSSACLRPSRERLLARVYPRASSDSNLRYHYDPSTGAFSLQATGRLGDGPTILAVPSEVTGRVSVSGAVAAEPSAAESGSGRTVIVYPSGGEFSIAISAAPQVLTACTESSTG